MATEDPHSRESDRVHNWLKSHGFSANPFAEWEASHEKDLQSYFYSLPFWKNLYGKPDAPITTFLFAGRGCGKTAHRLVIEASSRPQNPQSSVLAVPYTDFTSFITESGAELRPVVLRDHLLVILCNAAETLVQELTQRPAAWHDLLTDEQEQLKQIVQTYAPRLLDPRSLSRRFEALAAQRVSARTFQTALSQGKLTALAKEHALDRRSEFSFWLSFVAAAAATEAIGDAFSAFRRLVDLAELLGLEAIFVLVDGLDELPETVSTQARAEFLSPLVTNLSLMEMPHVAFKFFLPITLGAALRKNENIRFDHFHVYQLIWEPEWLRDVLAIRLTRFNKAGKSSLAALAEESAQAIDDDLVRKAQGSPRALILLGHLLFEAHCARTNEKRSLLSQEDFKSAARKFENEYRVLITSVPLLRVDENARKLYLGGRELEVKLSAREFAVLVFLYRARTMLRTEEEITAAVPYSSNIAFDSMMSRLRGKFEPDPRNPVYLVTEHGRGYRLVNTE